MAVASEGAFTYWGERGLVLSESIERKIADSEKAYDYYNAPIYKYEGVEEAWGDKRNRKVGGDFIIYVNSLELDELLDTAKYLLELWENTAAGELLLSVWDGYTSDEVNDGRMKYYSTLRSLKTAVKRLKKLAGRKEDVYYAEA